MLRFVNPNDINSFMYVFLFVITAPTSCVEKREMALSSDNLGEFVPQCTADGQFTSQQCHGSIGHCWCVDDQGMELGATRRGPGEELLDCEGE